MMARRSVGATVSMMRARSLTRTSIVAAAFAKRISDHAIRTRQHGHLTIEQQTGAVLPGDQDYGLSGTHNRQRRIVLVNHRIP